MSSNKFDCKRIFQEAFENRYTWPQNFNGYKGSCLFNEKNSSYQGDFIINKNFQPSVQNIEEKEIVKKISSQLFEVVIHRVRKSFEDIHSKNEFHFLRQSEKGIEMKVSGKNYGDKYRVKDGSINMVFRKMHGVIIEIFVEDFFDTGIGILSRKYTSQQLDIVSLKPKNFRYEYLDNFVKIQNTNLWVLESRTINYLHNNKEILHEYIFKDFETI